MVTDVRSAHRLAMRENTFTKLVIASSLIVGLVLFLALLQVSQPPVLNNLECRIGPNGTCEVKQPN
jgi:hypothetical protein